MKLLRFLLYKKNLTLYISKDSNSSKISLLVQGLATAAAAAVFPFGC